MIIPNSSIQVLATPKFIITAPSLPVCYSLGGLAILLILTGIVWEVVQQVRLNASKRNYQKLSDVELLEKIWKMHTSEEIEEDNGDKNIN